MSRLIIQKPSTLPHNILFHSNQGLRCDNFCTINYLQTSKTYLASPFTVWSLLAAPKCLIYGPTGWLITRTSVQIMSLNTFRLNVKVKQPASGLSLCHIRTLMRNHHLTLTIQHSGTGGNQSPAACLVLIPRLPKGWVVVVRGGGEIRLISLDSKHDVGVRCEQIKPGLTSSRGVREQTGPSGRTDALLKLKCAVKRSLIAACARTHTHTHSGSS